MGTDKSPKFHVFISHSSEDRAWADEACRVLERRKMRCWLAPRNITPGTEWGEAIIDGIDRSRVMVLIFSANANQSSQVRREVERAIGKSIPILPLRIEDIRPKGALEFALSNTHWLDAFVPPAEDRLARMAEAVEALLGVKPEHQLPKLATTSAPIIRKSRSKRLIASLLILSAIIGCLAFYFYDDESPSTFSPSKTKSKAGKTVASSVTDSESSASADTPVDETFELQGRWVAVAESALHGPFTESKVKERNFILIIMEHSVTHRRQSTLTKTETLSGFISFDKENEKRTFAVRGTDSEGVFRTWIGLYAFSDDTLALCYRESEGRGVQPIVPVTMNESGQRGTHYVKLVRSGMRKKR